MRRGVSRKGKCMIHVDGGRRAQFASVVAVLVAVVLMFAPVSAHASGYFQAYCGIVKGSGHWCGARGAHSWDQNKALADGAPNRYVCQRIWHPDTASAVEQTCGYGMTIGVNVNRSCVCYGAHVAQFSGVNNPVWGEGWA